MEAYCEKEVNAMICNFEGTTSAKCSDAVPNYTDFIVLVFGNFNFQLCEIYIILKNSFQLKRSLDWCYEILSVVSFFIRRAGCIS